MDASLKKFVVSLVEEINATVPCRSAVQLDAKQQRALAREADSVFDSEILRDGVDQMEFWRRYRVSERAEVGATFRQLAERGKLPKQILLELIADLRRGMRYRLDASVHKGRPVVKQIMVFNSDPQIAYEAKVALGLLTLAGDEDGHVILECPHNNCGQLFLRKPNEKGRKRETCEDHVNAYRQARHRARASKQAAKHK